MTTISEWINQIINGPAGMNDFERHELVDWLESDRYCAASWAIRCLANPHCEGSQEVLDAVIEQRERVAAREREKLQSWQADAGAVGD
jgi:hypothetical protein